MIGVARDAEGKAYPVMYSTLANGGHGNGVLSCMAAPFTGRLPVMLAFGDVVRGEGAPDGGFLVAEFLSYERMGPVIRGVPAGNCREAIRLEFPLCPRA